MTWRTGHAALARFIIAVALAPAVGCGDDPAAGQVAVPTFPAQPFLTVASAQALFDVALRAAPAQPPPRGVDAIQYEIADSSGAPVAGLGLTVVPWMPAHGHGTSVRPTVVDNGDGTYDVNDVVLFMQGRWELRTTIARGAAEDSVTPAFDVP